MPGAPAVFLWRHLDSRRPDAFARGPRGGGPGIITANVDNDPGGILTYSQPPGSAPRCYGHWFRRRWRWSWCRKWRRARVPFTMLVLGLADLGNIAAEFAGVASAVGIFGISKYVAVPLAALLVWSVVVRGT
jgi:Mn2+/Fe2+ NRAMP family transporter